MTWEGGFKTAGYLVSTVSVACLGVVAWDGARERPLMLFLLLAGMATSVGGMLLRWLALSGRRRDEQLRERRRKKVVQDSLNIERIDAATARRR
jgi:hypothetical protein